MTNESLDEKAIFNIARQIEAADARSDYLRQVCGNDDELRERVNVLLRAYEEQMSFLESPAGGAAATIDQPISEKPGTEIGPYKLLQLIGEGGMGVVYMAEQKEPIKRRVALKIIKPGMDTRQVIARFEAERQALAMMDHPNIAKVLDAGATNSGRPYFVMELVNGLPVTKYADEQHLTPTERLELFVPICQAVQHAHQKGIIHRDLKPSNILVALYDGQPVPKVIDFGVAKATSQTLTEKTIFTHLGQVIGTLEYMSPEQAERNQLDIDTRSDIYSLGVVLYELLTGETPFDRQRLRSAAFDEVLRIIREEEPARPSTRLSSSHSLPSIAANRKIEPARLSALVRGELDWIVMKALEKDRGRRYETANAFAIDVQRYLLDEPVQACPPSTGYRLLKFARRNRGALAVSSAVLVAVLMVVGGFGWMIRDRAAWDEKIAREQAARQEAMEREVKLALEEVQRLQEQAKWPQAMEAIRRADGLLAAGGSEQLRDQVRQVRKDVEMVLQLEEIPLLPAESMDKTLDHESVDQSYAQAFSEYGIDVLQLPTEKAAALIRSRASVAIPLITALDYWAFRVRDPARVAKLQEVAGAADSDPWSRQVREASLKNDAEKLASLADLPDLPRQPPIRALQLALAMRSNGQTEAASAVLRRAQIQHLGDFWINMELARTLRQMGPPHWDDAIGFYRAALATRPQNSAVLNSLGNALRGEQKRFAEAATCFTRAIELRPGVVFPHNNLGVALKEMGKLDEAIAAYRTAIDVDPTYAFAYCNLGNALSEQDKLAEAVAAYEKAIELDPNYTNALNNLGNALQRLKRFDEAIGCYEKAIALDPRLWNAHHGFGETLWQQGKRDAAIAAYRKAIECDPDKAITHEMLGFALTDQGQLNDAIEAFRTAVQLQPELTKARTALAHRLGTQGRYGEAVDEIREVIRLKPQDASAYNDLGWYLAQKGQVREAIAAYRESLRLKSDYVRANGNLAWLLATGPDPKQWDGAQAVQLIAAASESAGPDPNSRPVHWRVLGAGHYRAGNWKEAIAALDQSIRLRSGGDATDWFFLAMAHWQSGDHPEARRWYDQAAEWMEKERPNDAELLRFRAEAAALLGVDSRPKSAAPSAAGH